MNATFLHTQQVSIDFPGTQDALWRCSLPDGFSQAFAAPVFEVDGRPLKAVPMPFAPEGEPRTLPQGAVEHVFAGPLPDAPGLRLRLVMRVADDSPVIRFRYELVTEPGAPERHLTKISGRDAIDYLALDTSAYPLCREIRLGEFDEAAHAFRPSENDVGEGAFANRAEILGPILAFHGDGHAALAAYEHGSTAPEAYLAFALEPARRVRLRAVRGNYWNGRSLGADIPFETVWFDVALLQGGLDDLAHAFRQFVLHRMSPNMASRRPYVFYNTWASQERDHWWNRSGSYLAAMNPERILRDIEIAHRMGIEVFVLDTGWFEKTGDWRVSRRRFPEGLEPIRRRLEELGMRLGLWFSPAEAALSSDILARNRGCVTSRDGNPSRPHSVWETEESLDVCLVSAYWRDFADELVRVAREWGVTYFKWDAIGQHVCDAAAHAHGGDDISAAERLDCYAFEQVRYMARIVDRLCEACPEAIVDFDVTEGGRSFGLAFLAAGKFFTSNNGPYYQNLDIKPEPDHWINVYVHPGPARAWVMRPTLDFDRWIPSVLLLGHYLPDGSRDSQLVNLASLVLGQNGIWGDLQSVSEEGVALFGEALAAYRKVRGDVTEADPIRVGRIGGCPEVHEKLTSAGRGAVAVFATTAGEYEYVTRHSCRPVLWKSEGVEVTHDDTGRAVLRCTFPRASARLVFFG